MLLRSASSPILKSLTSVSAETSPRSTNHLRLSSTSLAPRCSTASTMTMSESNASSSAPPVPKSKERVSIFENEEEESATISQSSSLISRRQGLLAISGLDTQARSPSPPLVLDEGCVGDGGSGGRICSGGASGESGFFSDSNESMDVYYREMIQANPSDPLILGNYAKYLKEVRGDLDKAEEYCERAILANKEEDGSVLSMYADITWERSKDAERAEAYFDRAVQAAPEDCYIAASYARFLWDAEEEEEREEQGKKENLMEVKAAVPASWTPPPPPFFPGQATTSAIAAAS